MPNTINADSGAISSVPGVKVTADTSGVLALQADGTTIATLTTSGGNQMVVSGVVTLPAGSAAAPSIAPTGDSNTGIFFPAADTIAFSEGGVEAIRLTSTGNLQFSATGQRITGDFSNATLTSRLAFQTSTTNGNSTLNLLPNGSGTTSQYAAYGSSDPTNAPFIGMVQVGTTESRLQAAVSGSGSFAPLTFYTGGSERARIDTSGNVGIGTSSPTNKFQVSGDSVRSTAQAATAAGTVEVEAQVYNYWSGTGGPTYTGTAITQAGVSATGTTCGISNANLGTVRFQNGSVGLIYTNGGQPIVFGTTGTERMRIASTGAIGLSGANYGTSGQVLTSNGSGSAPSWQLPAGLPTMNIVSGTTQTAVANNHYVLTNASATTVTLPAGPAAGDVVWVTVANGRVDNVVARNGQNINSLAENMTIDSAYAGVQLRYADATRGWVFT